MFSIHQSSTRNVTQHKGSDIFYIASPRKQLRLDQWSLRDVEEKSESRAEHQELGVTQEMLKLSQKEYEVAQHDQHYEQSQNLLGSLQGKELISHQKFAYLPPQQKPGTQMESQLLCMEPVRQQESQITLQQTFSSSLLAHEEAVDIREDKGKIMNYFSVSLMLVNQMEIPCTWGNSDT